MYTQLTGERDERVLDAINAHMFPLKLPVPRHREGWILTLADKVASSLDVLDIPIVTEEERDELLQMAEEPKG